MQAFARAYTGRRAKQIRYQMDGRWVDAGTAARFDALDVLNVRYEGDQDVYVNLSSAPLEADGHKLPPFGTFTAGPRAVAWTALRQGQICDYARYGEVTYVDARSDVWQVPEGIAPIEPSIAAFDYKGGDDFTLSIKWKAGRVPDRDYNVFWHFRHDGKIKLQRDFRPHRKTSRWQVGEEIITGPFRVSLKEDSPDGEYSIVVGLYDKQGRATLLGSASELQVGRLTVERRTGRAKSIRLESTPPVGPPGTLQKPYLEGMNAERKVIDFGTLATNGAVVASETKEGLRLTPVPIGQVMTVGLKGNIDIVEPHAADGSPLPPPALRHAEGKTWFETSPEATCYLVK